MLTADPMIKIVFLPVHFVLLRLKSLPCSENIGHLPVDREGNKCMQVVGHQ